jgi:transposase
MKVYEIYTHISSLSREQKEKVRMNAGKLFKKGVSQAEVSRRLKVTHPAVSYWYATWKKKGMKGLLSKGHSGFASKLTEKKRQAFKEAILAGPDVYGYPTNLWTLPRLSAVMKTVTKVKFSEVWTWHIVRDLGFTPQKPQVKAKQRNEKAIKEWKWKTLPDLKKMGWKPRISLGI